MKDKWEKKKKTEKETDDDSKMTGKAYNCKNWHRASRRGDTWPGIALKDDVIWGEQLRSQLQTFVWFWCTQSCTIWRHQNEPCQEPSLSINAYGRMWLIVLKYWCTSKLTEGTLHTNINVCLFWLAVWPLGQQVVCSAGDTRRFARPSGKSAWF